MDPAIHLGTGAVGDLYRAFAEREARGVSATYQEWALGVGGDGSVAALIETLPARKRQPNLVFAAARWHGARGGYPALRATLLERWPAVRSTTRTDGG